MNRAILLLVMTILSLPIFAQSKLTGTVVDGTTGEALIGASIIVQGTGTGGVTDLDGHFSIDLPKGKTKVVVSSVGYTSQTISVAGKRDITVKLVEDSKVMDEVVVVGYGTMKKSDLSGSLSSLAGNDLMKGGAMDIAHGMQGKIAGVQVNQSDGAPGGGMSIVKSHATIKMIRNRA